MAITPNKRFNSRKVPMPGLSNQLKRGEGVAEEENEGLHGP